MWRRYRLVIRYEDVRQLRTRFNGSLYSGCLRSKKSAHRMQKQSEVSSP
jgi:hypothetical protein